MTLDIGSETGSLDTEESRRSFLSKFASGVFAGLIAPAVMGKTAAVASVQTEQGINTDLSPIVELPPAVEGEHPVERMQRDLQRALQKPVEQRKWGMMIDLRKCVGCNGCNVACITENKLPPGVTYRPVLTETVGTYPNVARRFVPRPCMHCEEPPCVPVCPVNATFKTLDGVVAIDYDMCIGCRYCITACPYAARSFDSGYFYGELEGGDLQPYELLPSPEYGLNLNRSDGGSPIGNTRKCHFCIHRVQKGELPACVLSCMGRATYFGDLNDPESLISELTGQPNVMRLKEELGTKPQVYYLT